MIAPRTDLESPVDPSLGAVVAVTGSVPVVVTVTAVVVTRGRSPYLAATLAAVRAQTYAPDAVVVVDVDTAPATSAHLDLQLGDARFVAGAGARTFGEGVDAALAAAGVPERGWIWLLHDDCAPAPGALAALMRAIEHSAAVAVAGCKQRRWELAPDGAPLDPAESDRGVLLEVGHTVTRLGRRTTGVDHTEIDQGQHDATEDVLAVGLAGALVRTQVWATLRGTDPEPGPYGDSTDFCRRVRLAGHRVVVVPQAVVRHAQASLLGLRGRDAARSHGRGARRRAQLYQRLAWAHPALVPVAAVAMVLWAPVQAAYRLALKQPGHARDELLAPLWVLSRVVPLARARRNAARTRVVPRGVLRPLTASWRDVWAERRDRRLARAELHRTGTAPSDLEQVELRRLAARRRTALVTVLLAATALAVAVFGPAVGTLTAGGRLVGGALLPAGGTVGDVWSAATSGWVLDGLGAAAPADPLLLPLAGLAALTGGSLQTAVHGVFLLAFPLAAAGGWAAAGAVTRSPWLRAWAALLWLGAPALLVAVGTGRLGALVAHLVLPWVALALARAVGAHAVDVVDVPEARTEEAWADRTRHGRAAVPAGVSLGAAGAAGLLLALAVSGAPVLLPAAVVVLAGAALAVRRRRRYLALALLPAVVAGTPLWWAAVRGDGGWRLLLAEPLSGTSTAGTGGAGWHLLLGWPAPPAAWFPADVLGSGAAAAFVAAAVPYLAGAVVVLLAVVALFRRDGAASRTGWLVAAVGLGVAVLAQQVARDGSAWAGPGLSLLLLGLGAAALRGAPSPLGAGSAVAGDRTPAPDARPTRQDRLRGAGRTARLVGVGVLGTLAVVAPVAVVTVWAVDGSGSARPGHALHATAEPVVPAVGRQMQAPPRQARVLEVRSGPDGVVTYTPLRGDGTQLLDASAAAAAVPPGPADAALDVLVAELARGAAQDLGPRLAALGIGAVQVRSADEAGADLVATLDLVPGLSRVTEGQAVTVWRVAPETGPEPGWARVEVPSAGVVAVLPSRGAEVRAAVDPGDAARVVVLAEAAGPGWGATLDGRRLDPVEVPGAEGLQAFALGAEGGRLVVAHTTAYRPLWLAVAGITLVAFAMLALPVARRRTR
ncbi:glycosyltransferase [Antribacter gilvus]|uniref:glycosyltransferase n=1 Tax=Antribacter gilvus TaxID=2304675 RepID=UPI000F7B351B|nr:glycosyltransferase [Antribacter gilvus]